MDTISRENSSYLPVAGIILAGLAFVLAAVALVKVSSNGKTLAAHSEQLARIDTIENEVRTSASNVDAVSKRVAGLQRDVQDALTSAANEIGNVRAEVTKLQEAAKARPAAAAAGNSAKSSTPAIPGEEYVVKNHDTGAKIARSAGVSLSDLTAVNPGVNWNKLAIGTKIKLPKKN